KPRRPESFAVSRFSVAFHWLMVYALSSSRTRARIDCPTGSTRATEAPASTWRRQRAARSRLLSIWSSRYRISARSPRSLGAVPADILTTLWSSVDVGRGQCRNRGGGPGRGDRLGGPGVGPVVLHRPREGPDARQIDQDPRQRARVHPATRRLSGNVRWWTAPARRRGIGGPSAPYSTPPGPSTVRV